MKSVILAACLGFLLVTSGCVSSPYIEGYYYLPRPAEAVSPTTQPVVTTYVTVVGIHRAEPKRDLPESIRVRIRIDNDGAQPITFDANSMRLTTGNLFRFPNPIVEENPQLSVPSLESAMIEVIFPFPDHETFEDLDLHTLMLQWSVEAGSDRISQSARFYLRQQQYYYYEGPYWGEGPFWSGPYYRGAIIIHRR